MSGGAGSSDDESFDAAFDRLFRVAYRSAYRILHSREDCEDVAIEALARGSVRWRSIHAHPEPWITKVSSNLAIDILRRRRSTVELTETIAPEVPMGDTLDLQRAMDRLPRRQRMTISLRYFSGLSERETAELMRCSTGTVKQHSSRGLATLRKALADGTGRASTQ